jgi:serine/threonine protein kinase HipA of HipAB toxin-antitoxin module
MPQCIPTSTTIKGEKAVGNRKKNKHNFYQTKKKFTRLFMQPDFNLTSLADP